jgi:hypothetical protein
MSWVTNDSRDWIFDCEFLVYRCPDGSAVIAQCENLTFQLFNPYVSNYYMYQPAQPLSRVLQTVSLTQNLPSAWLCFISQWWCGIPNSMTSFHLAAIQTIRQPSPILDFIWYPTATPQNPASFCFVASVRECPVKLLDASDGRVCSLTQPFP